MTYDNGQNQQFNEPSNALPDDQGESYETTDESMVVAHERPQVSRSTLAIFGVLVIGAVGLYLMYRQTGPKAASAAISKESSEARKTINTFLSGGDTNVKSMETFLRTTEKKVQEFLKYPSTRQVPLAELMTNPFRQHASTEKRLDTSVSDALDRKRQEEERLAIHKAAKALHVQSIMCSETRKACMINNTLYREGQTIDDFVIDKISPTAIVVRNGQYKFELRMQ
jgi:hypothetical protein